MMPPIFSAPNNPGSNSDRRSETACHVSHHFHPVGRPESLNETIHGADNRQSNRAPVPFVWQYGTQLILLDDDSTGWVMAELRFDPDLCRYVEVRRAVYDLTREAIGAVISRALASGDHAAVDTALCLHDWLHAYYGIAIVADVLASPEASYLEFTL